MKSVLENIQLSKDMFHQILWTQECLVLGPELPQGVLKVNSCSSSIRSPQRQMANALGKHQFIVDN